MAKFHVNPATGEPGQCKAENGGCPFGSVSDHFDSPAAAREGYEQEMQAGEKREELTKLADKLVASTLKLRSVMDERKAHKAGDPEWADIRDRAETAKAENDRVIAKVAKHGITPKDLIYGVNDEGKVFNLNQVHRVRPRSAEAYSKLAGVPLRAGSELPMPGDSEIAKRQDGWSEAKAKLEKLPEGSKERAAAVKSLSKRVLRESPDPKVKEQMERNVQREQIVERFNGNPPVSMLMRYGLPAVDMDPVGLVNEKEYEVYGARAKKAADDFIAGLK